MASRSKDASARGLIPRLSDSRLIFARGQFRPRPWARCCRFNNATRHCVSVPILGRVFVTTDKSPQQQPFRFGTFIEGAGPYSACLAVTHFHRRNGMRAPQWGRDHSGASPPRELFLRWLWATTPAFYFIAPTFASFNYSATYVRLRTCSKLRRNRGTVRRKVSI